MNRVHLTSKPFTGFLGDIIPQKVAMKPKGLWYSVGDEWEEWCKSEMPHCVHKHKYSLEIDTKKLLILTNENVQDFSRNNNVPLSGMGAYDMGYQLDWPRIAKTYYGVEVSEYSHELHFNFDMMWYNAWDVASGCVWDSRALKGFKKL